MAAVEKYWPGDKQTALRVMYAESGGRAGAVGYNTNGTTDTGCFQINSIHIKRVSGNLNLLNNPEINVGVAAQIWSEQGWCPWVAARKLGICRK